MATSGSRGIAVTSVYGLIDNNTFDVTATSGYIQSLSIWGSSANSDGGLRRRNLLLRTLALLHSSPPLLG